MSKLQSDFTTPEQSKRLLELGVPEDSANCYLTRFGIDEDWEVKVLNNVKYSEITISNQDYCLPCWSVGRLIEIYLICNEVIDNVTELHHSAIKIDIREFNIVEYIIRKLSNKVKKNNNFFSKLEE